MAVDFSTISTKFFNESQNDTDFQANPTVFSTRLTGNIGDSHRLVQEIELAITYNLFEAIETSVVNAESPLGAGMFANGINFIGEGFIVGAQISIEWKNASSTQFTQTPVTITAITGVGNSTLYIDQTSYDAMFAQDGTIADAPNDTFVFKQLTEPKVVRYSYELAETNPSQESAPYLSRLDDNKQTYYTNEITGSATELIFLGGEVGASLGNANIKYDGATSGYKHKFTLVHDFKALIYLDGEVPNLTNGIRPARYQSGNTLKYNNQFKFGSTSAQNSILTQEGEEGNYGYQDENFNGFQDNYTVQNVTITNALGTGTIELTQVNTVTFQIKDNNGNFGENPIIAGHQSLLSSTQYANSTVPYDVKWNYDTLRNIVGQASVDGEIINEFTANLDVDLSIINVSMLIDFSEVDVSDITDENGFYLFCIVANRNLLDANITDRVTKKIAIGSYSRDTDVAGLIDDTDYTQTFYPAYDVNNKLESRSDLTGGDGDLWMAEYNFKLLNEKLPIINYITFQLLSIDSNGDEFEVSSQNFNFSNIFITGHQLINENYANGLRIPFDNDLNRVLISVTTESANAEDLERDVRIQFGFQVPWQYWIQNTGVNTVFYDTTKPNNNLNNQTSNYSNKLGFEVFPALKIGLLTGEDNNITPYRFKGGSSEVLEFDSEQWIGTSGSIGIYDLADNPLTFIPAGVDTKVVIPIVHDQGIIPIGTLVGEAFMMRKESQENPSYLSTAFDYVMNSNYIKGETASNLISISSTNNLVTLTFLTEGNNITNDTDYSIYGRVRIRTGALPPNDIGTLIITE